MNELMNELKEEAREREGNKKWKKIRIIAVSLKEHY